MALLTTLADEGGLHLLKPDNQDLRLSKTEQKDEHSETYKEVVGPTEKVCETYVDLLVKGAFRKSYETGSSIFKLAVETISYFLQGNFLALPSLLPLIIDLTIELRHKTESLKMILRCKLLKFNSSSMFLHSQKTASVLLGNHGQYWANTKVGLSKKIISGIWTEAVNLCRSFPCKDLVGGDCLALNIRCCPSIVLKTQVRMLLKALASAIKTYLCQNSSSLSEATSLHPDLLWEKHPWIKLYL